MKTFCVAVLSLALISCHSRKSPETDAKKSASPSETTAITTAAKISANPNPVPAGPGDGETTITWDTGEAGAGEIYVSKDDQPEDLLATGKAGSQMVKWIQSHSHYVFRLYEGSAHSKLLGKVEVKRQD